MNKITLGECDSLGILDADASAIAKYAARTVYYRGSGWYSLTDAGNFIRGIIPTYCRIHIGAYVGRE